MGPKPIAIVTGATGGIGLAICQVLAREWDIIGTCHKADDAAVKRWHELVSVESTLVRFDIANHEEATHEITSILAQRGCPAVLVNCAGMTADGFFSKMTFSDWEGVIRTNLISLFSVTQPIYRAMCAQGSGAIINISSINGERGQAGQTNYCASKAGVHGFTMALAREAAKFGVRVNTVSPGYTMTPMVAAMRSDIQAKIAETIPMGRFAEAEEIANLVKYLASNEARYITGANLHINGGQHIG